MGKNNRPRRAAKRSAARERRSPLRPGGPAADSGSRTDTRFRGGTANPFTRVEDSPSVGRLRREQAERCLQRLLLARGSAKGLAHLVEQELISLQSQELRKLDELVTVRLQYIVAQLWEPGWLLLVAMCKSGLGLVQAWVEIITVAGLISEVPVLERIAPPPSEWGKAGDRVASDPDSERARVLMRIRALLAKAEATDHAAEAETFTAKAQDLMTRHAIDDALLAAAGHGAVTAGARRVHLQNPYATTKTSLLNAVATANRCKVIYFDRLAIATVVGVPLDIDQVEMLFVSLLVQATRAMTEAGAGQAGSFDRSARFRRSFLAAYAVRIGERLTESTSAATRSYGNELVPLLKRQDDAVSAEFERLFPFTRQVSDRYLDPRGWDAGRRAADRAVFAAGRLSA